MTVILVLATFAVFILVDWVTGKKPIVDERLFDHSHDQFANLGFTMADGGKKI